VTLWNTSGFGQFLCWMGCCFAIWVAAAYLTEESVLAEVSRCTEYEAVGGWPVPERGKAMISCTAVYARKGRDIAAELQAPRPSDYDLARERRWALVWVSPLQPNVVRFKTHPKDWATPMAKLLGLEFLGLLLIVAARRAPDFSMGDD
jgi:hypothetical protein